MLPLRMSGRGIDSFVAAHAVYAIRRTRCWAMPGRWCGCCGTYRMNAAHAPRRHYVLRAAVAGSYLHPLLTVLILKSRVGAVCRCDFAEARGCRALPATTRQDDAGE